MVNLRMDESKDKMRQPHIDPLNKKAGAEKDTGRQSDEIRSKSGVSIVGAMIFYLVIVTSVFSISVVFLVNINLNRFFSDGLDEFFMRDMLAIRNSTLSFLDDRIKILHDHAGFPQIVKGAKYPDHRNAALNQFMQNLSLLGDKYQLSLLTESGRTVHATLPRPVFNYIESSWIEKLHKGGYKQYTGVSHLFNEYFWRLAVPVVSEDTISGFLVAEIPVEAIDADRDFSLILSGSQVQFLTEGAVIATFGKDIDAPWEKFNLPAVGAVMRYRADQSTITRLYRGFMLKLTVILFGLSIIAISVAVVMGKRFFALPLIQSRILTAALAQGATVMKLPANDKIREIGLLGQTINIMVDKIIKRENSLREDRDHLETRVHERTKALRQEIAERKKVEQALRQSERRLQLALEGANLGLWDWNIKTGELIVNARFAEIIGYTMEEIDPTIDFWKGLIHPDDYEEVMGVLKAHIEGNISFYVSEHRLKTKDGGWKWVLARGKVVEKDRDGKPHRASGTHLDIHNRKRIEEEMVRIRKAVACSSDAISISSHEGGLYYCNEAFVNMFAYTAVELNQPGDVLSLFVHADEGLKILQGMKRGLGWTGEIEFRSKNGDLITVYLRANSIKDEMDEIIGFVWTHTDITERKNVVAELERAKQLAESANQAKNDFLAGMSYELLTPLKAVIEYAERLKTGGGPEASPAEIADSILSSGRYVHAMIADILDLSKIEANKMELEPVDFHLIEFLNGVTESIAGRADEKGLGFDTRFDGKLPEIVRCDRKCLRRALVVLLNNAVNRTNEGGIRFSAAQETERNGKIRFCIADTGSGIPAQPVQSGFPPGDLTFGFALNSDKNGLELTISWKLIRLMGGDLFIDSTPENGNTLWFEINTGRPGLGANTRE